MAKMKIRGRVLILAEPTTKRRGALVLLENRGFLTTCADSPEDASNAIRAWAPDLMVVEEGLSVPSASPPTVPLGRTALEMIGAVEDLVERLKPRVTGTRAPVHTGPWTPLAEIEVDEHQVRETVRLADEAVRRALIASFALRGKLFRIMTLRADYTFAPPVAICFLKQLLAESTRTGHTQ